MVVPAFGDGFALENGQAPCGSSLLHVSPKPLGIGLGVTKVREEKALKDSSASG